MGEILSFYALSYKNAAYVNAQDVKRFSPDIPPPLPPRARLVCHSKDIVSTYIPISL